MPLSRVRELLDASEDEFAVAVTEIDRRLRAEIRALQRHRERIAGLAGGEGLTLPPEAVSYLSTLRSIGVAERIVAAERDAWILVAAQLPEQMSFSMGMKQQQITDPSVQELYRDLAEVIE